MRGTLSKPGVSTQSPGLPAPSQMDSNQTEEKLSSQYNDVVQKFGGSVKRQPSKRRMASASKTNSPEKSDTKGVFGPRVSFTSTRPPVKPAFAQQAQPEAW
eukprot:562655_1